VTTLSQRLRHRVDIEALATSQDSDTGAESEAWDSILDSDAELVPAEIVALSGREFIAAQAGQAGITTRITLRWRTDLKAHSTRIVHDGTAYNIEAILPDPSLRGHVTLMCSSGVNVG
jgi:SPP1 family predicted phage head-tail adaptor